MAFNFLVVDDSPMMRKIIIKTLKQSGLSIGEIYQAGNGQEGLDLLASNKIDIAFVDMYMPVMDGDEMVDKLRENPKTEKLPVIFISSESSTTKIEMLQKKGAGFVHKPFSAEILKEHIVNMIKVENAESSAN